MVAEQLDGLPVWNAIQVLQQAYAHQDHGLDGPTPIVQAVGFGHRVAGAHH